jgi:hypothetical protein
MKKFSAVLALCLLASVATVKASEGGEAAEACFLDEMNDLLINRGDICRTTKEVLTHSQQLRIFWRGHV